MLGDSGIEPESAFYSILGLLYQKISHLYLVNPMQLCEEDQDNNNNPY